MPNITGPKQPSGDWELFLGMWERANLVRSFFWSQRPQDEKVLLAQFLPRLRRYFGVDFCFGALSASEETLIEVGVPEATLSQLPQDFARRCLESVANSRAPVTWKDAGIGLGFRSTVVAPLRAPTGAAFGFLMLGNARPRTYTAVELFVLQALAGELSWVVRDLAARKAYQHKLAVAAHGAKNALQIIVGNTALMRQKLKDTPSGEGDKHLAGIETAVQQVLDRLRVLPDSAEEGAAVPTASDDIASMVNQSLASCQQTAKERGVEVEVVYTADTPAGTSVVPERVKGILSTLVDNAALATRNETLRLTVRRGTADLELVVKGTGSNRVADRLKALFEDASRWEGARNEPGGALLRVREYLNDAGGDVYLKSRPGEAAEFVVRLPIEGAAQTGRL